MAGIILAPGTPGPGFSAVPHGGNAADCCLASNFGVREQHSMLAMALLLDFGSAGALPGTCASNTRRLRTKRSPQEDLDINIKTSLASLIMGPQFLQIRTLYLIK